jgi:hypothetical protein
MKNVIALTSAAAHTIIYNRRKQWCYLCHSEFWLELTEDSEITKRERKHSFLKRCISCWSWSMSSTGWGLFLPNQCQIRSAMPSRKDSWQCVFVRQRCFNCKSSNTISELRMHLCVHSEQIPLSGQWVSTDQLQPYCWSI